MSSNKEKRSGRYDNPRGSMTDDVITQASKVGLLSQEEEFAIGQDIDSARQLAVEALALIKPVAQKLVEILKLVKSPKGTELVLDIAGADDLETEGASRAELLTLILDDADDQVAFESGIVCALEGVRLSRDAELLLRAELDDVLSTRDGVSASEAIGLTPAGLRALRKTLTACEHKQSEMFNLLIKHNTLYVAKVSGQYRGGTLHDSSDAFQIGILGLHRAAQKWDHTRGWKFCTYAHFWIHQALNREFSVSQDFFHVPSHICTKRKKLERTLRESRADGEALSQDAAGELLGFDSAELQRINEANTVVVSFESADKQDTRYLHEIVASDEPTPDEHVQMGVDCRLLLRALERLNAQEQKVLGLAFGLGKSRQRSSVAASALMKISLAEFERMKAQALESLRCDWEFGEGLETIAA